MSLFQPFRRGWTLAPNSRGVRLAVAALLFALNLAVCWRLLFVHYLPWFNSVEPFFFALAEHIKAHWPNLGWYPCWYGGMPFAYTYPPLLMHVAAAGSLLARCSVPHAFHIFVAGFYTLGPVTVYALVLRLSGRLDTAVFSALCYSLWSPSALLVHSIAVDIGGFTHARRLYNAVYYADSPQMAALTLVPLALLAVDCAARRPRIRTILVAAIALAAVPLTNIPGTIGLAMALVAYLLALDVPRVRSVLLLVCSALLGYLLICHWMPPSDLRLMLDDIGTKEPTLSAAVPLWYVGLAAAALVLNWAMARLRMPLIARFAGLFSLVTGTVALSGPWFGVRLLEQADRFHVILEMAVAILAGVILGWLASLHRAARIAVVGVVVVLAGFQFRNYRHFARRIVSDADVTRRSEYKVARWMEQNAGGTRVLVPGSTSFLLNSVTSTPQMAGCCEQNALSRAEEYAYYQFASDDGATPEHSAEVNIAWMKALGVAFVATSDASSTEVYRDLRHPCKFNGLLPLRWRDAGDFIYEVPLPSHALAHAVYADELVRQAPVNGLDVQPLSRYVHALEDPSRPSLTATWLTTTELEINGPVAPGQHVSVQISYHPGWRATANGRPARIARDSLGFIAVEPACSGPCIVRLDFTGGGEWLATRVVSLLAWLAVLIALAWDFRSRRRSAKGSRLPSE